jgi:hypothetical protein
MAWSYTALKKFETCPRQHNEVNIKKTIKEPETVHTIWGKRAHVSIDNNIKTGEPLIEGITKHTWIKNLCDEAIAKGATIASEQKVAITAGFKQTTWFAKDVWCRVIFDLTIVGEKNAYIWDWKTGRPRPDETQLDIFAGVGFKIWPDITVIGARFAWLQDGTQTRKTYTRLREFEIWEKILPRVVRLELAQESKDFPPTPGRQCRYCPVRSCEFNESKT